MRLSTSLKRALPSAIVLFLTFSTFWASSSRFLYTRTVIERIVDTSLDDGMHDGTQAGTPARSKAPARGSNTASPVASGDEAELENNLRPRDFSNYIGQERLKKNLKLAIDAAQ